MCVPTCLPFCRALCLVILFLPALAWSEGLSAPAQDLLQEPILLEGNSAKDTNKAPSPLLRLMAFVSRADGERCPMYPSCSHYARQAFAQKGIVKGWVLTSDRLLRCGRDETRLAPAINVHGVRHTDDPLEANVFWWDKR